VDAIGAHAEGLARAAATPMPVDYLDLDLAGLKSRIEEDEGDHALSLVLLDERDHVAQLVTDRARLDEAIVALDQVVEVAGRLAGLLRVRRGDRTEVLRDAPEPLPGDLAVVAALAAGPPMNAAGL